MDNFCDQFIAKENNNIIFLKCELSEYLSPVKLEIYAQILNLHHCNLIYILRKMEEISIKN